LRGIRRFTGLRDASRVTTEPPCGPTTTSSTASPGARGELISGVTDTGAARLYDAAMARHLVFALLLIAACGGRSSSAPAPIDTEGVCKVAPSVASGRRTAPSDAIGCDPDSVNGYGAACGGGDVDQCYQVGLCMENEWYGAEDDGVKRQAEEAALNAYLAACDGKIAEGCIRLGGVMDQIIRDTPAREAELKDRRCAAFRTACHLGEDTDGCPRCIANGCTGG
jgi:hypothetical protein